MTFQMAFKYCKRTSELVGRWENESGTHVGLDVLVLQVERVLPDIDADDGDERQEGVLVRGRRELEALRRRVVSLFRSLSRPYKNGEEEGRRTSQPQPEPWMPAVVVLNSFLRLSRLPKAATMASLRGPSLRSPPLPLFSDEAGAKFFQKSEWLM